MTRGQNRGRQAFPKDLGREVLFASLSHCRKRFYIVPEHASLNQGEPFEAGASRFRPALAAHSPKETPFDRGARTLARQLQVPPQAESRRGRIRLFQPERGRSEWT